ncbi:MAG: hypothetical protein MK108_11285 [Mariniblastus sp.]|nr:hypothetical protein [Mariniblastus sp.]
MNKHQHDTPPGYHKQDKHKKQGQPHRVDSNKGIHKDWRAWVALLLMLGAMAAYVLSGEESGTVVPGLERGPAGETTPIGD